MTGTGIISTPIVMETSQPEQPVFENNYFGYPYDNIALNMPELTGVEGANYYMKPDATTIYINNSETLANLDYTSEYTIFCEVYLNEYWITGDVTPQQQKDFGIATIANKGAWYNYGSPAANIGGWWLGFNEDTLMFIAGYDDDPSNINDTRRIITSPQGLTSIGQWLKVAVVINGTSVTLNVDGTESSGISLRSMNVESSVPICLGTALNSDGGSHGGVNSLHGRLRNFRFYNRALTACELNKIGEYLDGTNNDNGTCYFNDPSQDIRSNLLLEMKLTDPDTVQNVVVGVGNPWGPPPLGSATDAYDGSLPVTNVDNVDSDTLGSYQVIYTSVDLSGNIGRTVLDVSVGDLIAPVITLLGEP